jgi:hypothetical protein
MTMIRVLVVAAAALGQAGAPQAPSNLRLVTSGSRCAGVPSYPDASCTGVIPGTTLTACGTNLSTSNAVYDKCLFSGGISVTGKNITITNSRVMGVVSGDYTQSGLKMIDVEINGNSSTLDGTSGLYGYTCTRCNVHHAAKGFTGNGFTVIDSYVHDLYGAGDSHNEAVLGSQGNIVLRHSTFESKFSSNSSGGGMSSAISFYTHSTFWPGIDNILVEQNRISASGAVYCLYGGYSTDPSDGRPSNVRLIDNVFMRNDCGTGGLVIGWLQGNGNVWLNNKYSDGVTIPEPPSNQYARTAPVMPVWLNAKNLLSPVRPFVN